MKTLHYLFLAAATVFAVACDDDDPVAETTVAFSYLLPTGHTSDAVADSAILTINDVATGDEMSYKMPFGEISFLVLPDGLYNMTLIIKATHEAGGAKVQETFRDMKQNVQVVDGQMSVTFAPVRISGGQGFVFADVCLCSALADGLKSYTGDGWFRIANNSADTLYADGLCIVETKFNSVTKFDYTPDIMSDAMAVSAIYQIPGTGHDVQVLPGASILIADIAKDHTADNALSFNLTKADFEWYDETTKNLDTDTEAPNLTCVYKESKTIWVPNIQYNRAYAIGYLGGAFGKLSNEDYLANYTYDYTYNQMVKEVEKQMTGSAYRFENEWVLDAIQFAPSTAYVWSVVGQSLDAGYVSMGETGNDASRRGKSARRNFSNGMFVDTNNSADDFTVIATGEADPYYAFE